MRSINDTAASDGSNDLPEGWSSASLTDLCTIIRGVSYERGEAQTQPGKGLVPLLRANNIQDGLIFGDLQYVPEHRVSAEQILAPGDVIVAMSSGSKTVVGKTASLKTEWQGTFGAFCGVLRPKPGLCKGLFGLFFLTQDYRGYISDVAAGTNINNIKREHFERIDFPIPPLAEQERIVAKLEEVLARVNNARERLAKVPAILKRFRQSVLAAACSGRLTANWRDRGEPPKEDAELLLARIAQDRESKRDRRRNSPTRDHGGKSGDLETLPESWRWATLDQICQEGRPIIYGIIKPGPHDPKGIPYVRVTEMKDGNIDVETLRRASPERAAKFGRATLAAGDILISKDGTVGRVAVVPPELAGGNITQHLVRAAIHEFMHRDFIVLAIRGPGTQAWLSGETLGVALQGVNVEDFRRLPLPIPPLAEQREIARRVGILFALAATIEARVAQATCRADKLTQSTLAKAFRGELVPTEAELARAEGRSYESAADLLERIRRERPTHGNVRRRPARGPVVS